MKFAELGYKTKDEYFEAFYSTLMTTNRSAEFYVNWKKVYQNVQNNLEEISLLNGLVNISNTNERRKRLETILAKYPKTKEIIPLIIAKREMEIDLLILEKSTIKYLNVDFTKSNLATILKFCDDTGVVELLGNVKDLYSYLTGVEVGMDTNARKNRSGIVFENLVIEALREKDVDIRKASEKIDLGRNKTPDMIIYKNGKQFAFVEANFFFALGSKPLETIQSYVTLQSAARNIGTKFILITDGPAWKTGQNERTRAFDLLDYPLNLSLALKHIPRLLQEP